MNGDWLRTMVAVVDEGSFEAAADELHISASAVSQRVKALEAHLGQMVVRRTLPCTPTPAGEAVLRMARQVMLLTDEMYAGLARDGAGGVLRIVVNADSLATWFRPVLRSAAGWEDVVLRVEVEDQAHSTALLRRGDVVAAVTSTPTPVVGCRTVELGRMPYRPVASPELASHFGGVGNLDWERIPALRYNTKDDLQLDFLRSLGIETTPPQPQVPGSEAFLAAVEAGLAWGLIPEAQLGDALATGRLVQLADAVVPVPLHWQVWKVESPRVERLSACVLDAAAVLG